MKGREKAEQMQMEETKKQYPEKGQCKMAESRQERFWREGEMQ